MNAEAALARIPDRPTLVEARGLAESGRGRLLGEPDAPGFLVVGPTGEIAAAVGRPDAALVARLARELPHAELLAQADDVERLADLLPDRAAIRATCFTHPDPGSFRPGAGARLLEPGAAPDAWAFPPELAAELVEALRGGAPMAVVEFEGRVVSACYAHATTRTLWDVSVDTCSDLRRRGLAAAAFSTLAHALAGRGLVPVWGAVAGNDASLGLARKLGFRPAGEVWVLEPSAAQEPDGR